jgi:hypothetical protein
LNTYPFPLYGAPGPFHLCLNWLNPWRPLKTLSTTAELPQSIYLTSAKNYSKSQLANNFVAGAFDGNNWTEQMRAFGSFHLVWR